MTLEVEQMPRLITGGHGRHRNQRVKQVHFQKFCVCREVVKPKSPWQDRTSLKCFQRVAQASFSKALETFQAPKAIFRLFNK